ncbi:cytochrome P450 [Streptomyces sp. NPDC007808]|uniref:cytochrome P450 n=1 Tax=Streptomyces sp. NPDC007808 TaxID=3364779 RepID=UPI00368C6283
MFQGGYSTLAAAIGNAFDTLARHPDAQHALRAAPQLRATGVDELVRYDGPVQGTTRLAAADVTFGDITVRRGDAVTVLFQAANRDPDHFEHPDELLLDRSPNRHLSYGWGTHACLGTTVAQRVLLATRRRPRRAPARPAGGRIRTAPAHRHHAGLRRPVRHPPALTPAFRAIGSTR